MNRCLDERALVMFSVGERREEERSHLASCAECLRRYRELDDELRVIGAALRSGPPPRMTADRRPAGVRMWMLAPAMAAAALALLVAGPWLRGTPVTQVTLAPKPDARALSTYAEDVSAALSGGGETIGSGSLFEPPSTPRHPRIAEATEVEEALAVGSPCTGSRLFGADCNDYTSALYF